MKRWQCCLSLKYGPQRTTEKAQRATEVFPFSAVHTKLKWLIVLLFPLFSFGQKNEQAWIRINQLGYMPPGIKVAVYGSKSEAGSLLSANNSPVGFELRDARSDQVMYEGSVGKNFGQYGPFKETYRLNFTSFKRPGQYYLKIGEVRSPLFTIGDDVYKGTADFCLRYMRQQRSGFNPFLKDSCHTHDGYVLYGEKAGIKDSTHIDVVGGWHDASDYLQYATTSANATYHLLMAYRDFKKVFADEKQANGLDGKNGVPDVLDEAKWGLDWLLKMHPSADIMFNQVGDDRDHMGMRIPRQDTNYYGKGLERPVYFVSGEPQQRGRFMNNTTGTSSTAAKFSSAFNLGGKLFYKLNEGYSRILRTKALSALNYCYKKQGVTQTASVRSPYIYAEDNWYDDVELAQAIEAEILNQEPGANGRAKEIEERLKGAIFAAQQEAITPWMRSDTANHYQWYPFINLGHYELASIFKKIKNFPGQGESFTRSDFSNYYKKGIELVWNRAKQNAFYRGIPFIWCSNNLTTSFAIQCYWYRQLTGDKTFSELEQANIDWLFGCNPWGTSMVYGLPSWGDTPSDPHSAFTHLKNYPIDGGLVDGPVYTSIYKNLIGITLYQPDEYEAFQSDLAVYHDDYGDYSTNEPTMDGTASLIYLLAVRESEGASFADKKSRELAKKKFTYSHGGIIRGASTRKTLALVFTGHDFYEGGDFIAQTLKQEKVRANFFFTGKLLNDNLQGYVLVEKLWKQGHFLGNHSGHHLLYCDWNNRDSLLIDRESFEIDLWEPNERLAHLAESRPGGYRPFPRFFLPPYEWYNDTIAAWTRRWDIQLINYTPGTLSTADYTTPAMKNYRSSETIYGSIIDYEKKNPSGLNGFILLMHVGAGPERTDKFYKYLPRLIKYLKAKGYKFQTVDELLK
ncbi:MAG TPA: glycoside hydrolase family 9 protein [Chitinophagaceae bacterium]|nr:glycoside hydrolase family 9 protein [Chitinophagaceae bacterium]